MNERARNPWNRRGVVVCAIAWLGLSIGFGALIGSLNLSKYYALTTHGIESQGIVSAVEPQNHQYISYSYRVDGTVHGGHGNVGAGNPPFGSLRVGDAVLLYYLPQQPDISALGEPKPRLNNEIISVLGVMLVFPSLIVWRLVAKGLLPRP